MALDPRLTATLVCPVCKGAIVWDAEKITVGLSPLQTGL